MSRTSRGRPAGTWQRLLRPACRSLALLAALAPAPGAAQDTTGVSLEVRLSGDSLSSTRDPVVRTRNLLADTPWLATLREGLPVRLAYRLEVWSTRSGWLDAIERQVEWAVVVRHEPLLDQFSVVRLLPPNRVQQNRYATPGALAGALGRGYQFQVTPNDPGRYYYTVALTVTTLSDSDLEEFERMLRGELADGGDGGNNLAKRARRLVLRLAGLPTLNVSAKSEPFDVRPR
ncbi:MAG: hypothetical protein OEW17_02755 [Gemmatimonadota bacterium]|nr:hypothetical protein [Gemmatimonadota bacterium]